MLRGPRRAILDALRYPQTFLLIAILFLIVTGNQALIFFLPSITETMKSTAGCAPHHRRRPAVRVQRRGHSAQRHVGAAHRQAPVAHRRADVGHRPSFWPWPFSAGNHIVAHDRAVLPGRIHLAGLPPRILDAAHHDSRQVGGGHRRGADLPGQPGRIRRTLALRLSEDQSPAGSMRACGFWPAACCWPARSPRRSALPSRKGCGMTQEET